MLRMLDPRTTITQNKYELAMEQQLSCEWWPRTVHRKRMREDRPVGEGIAAAAVVVVVPLVVVLLTCHTSLSIFYTQGFELPIQVVLSSIQQQQQQQQQQLSISQGSLATASASSL